MPGYYDRQGNAITLEEWAQKFGERDYQSLAKDRVGDYNVSTVWLGSNHNYSSEGPPVIFETMLFWEGDGEPGERDQECHRYGTEEAALEGHRRLVESIVQPAVSDA